MNDEKRNKIEKLTGRNNFPGWFKLTSMELEEQEYLTPKTKQFASAKHQDALLFLMKRLSFKVLAMAPTEDGVESVWAWLKAEYGQDDIWTLKNIVRNSKMQGVSIDTYLETFNEVLGNYRAAGGKLSPGDQLDIILENIIKDNSNYIAFHDSGVTPSSYFKDRPANYTAQNGVVSTASKKSAVQSAGTGSVSFGD